MHLWLKEESWNYAGIKEEYKESDRIDKRRINDI